MKPLKVLEIISGFAVEGPLGGIERFGIELARSLDHSKVEPILCGMWAYGTPFEHEWVSRLQSEGIHSFIVDDWEASSPYRSFLRVQKKLRSFVDEVDIIHSHCQFGDMLALLNRRSLGAQALVRTVHNEKEWGKRPLRRFFLTNILYPFVFNLELGVAQQVTDNLNHRPVAQWFSKQSVKSYNALNLSRFTSQEIDVVAKKHSLGLEVNNRVVGTVGRLSPQKGIADLLYAAKIVVADFPDLVFLIIGDGELRSQLEEQVSQLELQRNVLFTGARSDIEELLPIMDVFVNSSHWEGLPTVIMESMAAKVPIIATNVGGNSELIQNNETGWLVPSQDNQRLATKIAQVLLMPQDELDLIRQNAYQRVHQRFSIEAVARQHEIFYEQLVTKPL